MRRIGNEFLVGGLIIVAVSLLVIHFDEMATGGQGSVVATCVLFLWFGGIATGLGLLLRPIGRARRPQVSPFSPAWRPPPAVRPRR